MCGRFLLSSPPDLVAALFQLETASYAPRWNIAPSQHVPVVRLDDGGARQLAHLKWGFVPTWAKDPSMAHSMINARSETAHSKPSFRSAMNTRRCLIVADGFYEWMKEGDRKRPHCIRMSGDGPFGMAGLWERWSPPGVEPIESCTILTTSPNALLKPIHDRMPVIVAPEHHQRWLDPAVNDAAQVSDLLAPYPAESMHAFEVSTRVNRPANDDESCLAPPEQRGLFG